MFYWKINQKAITEKYCENKARPELECNGQCHLKKQIKLISQEDSSKDVKNTIPSKKEVKFEKLEYINQSFSLLIIKDLIYLTDKPIAFISDNYLFQPNQSIFHPPLV